MANTRHDKYLTFVLGNEGYGIDIQNIKEINEMMAITPIPESPSFMRGIINLRGKLIPVIDLRERLGIQSQVSLKDQKPCIIVCDVIIDEKRRAMGIIVDGVNEVIEIKPEQVEQEVNLGSTACADYVCGIAKVNNQVMCLLDITKILSSDCSTLA